MGDLVFFIPPVLETLKKIYPDCEITFVTAWGFKDKNGWGRRNQGGFCIHLLMTNPHIDHLIHWHDTKLSLDKRICHEDGQSFPTWNKKHFEEQKKSGRYDGVYELDFGLTYEDNPIQKMYEAIGLPKETFSDYKLYLTKQDLDIASEIMRAAPRPRIVLLESLSGETTRNWDPGKIPELTKQITATYQVPPIWFGAAYVPYYQGRPLTLRQNIATLTFCDIGIGVLSGPLHFAVAVGLPTITLYCDHPLRRAAPAYFLNKYIKEKSKRHRTLLGPDKKPYQIMKYKTSTNPGFKDWQHPGRQTTKSCLSVITVDEIMTVLKDALPV